MAGFENTSFVQNTSNEEVESDHNDNYFVKLNRLKVYIQYCWYTEQNLYELTELSKLIW